jgi:hypothetical protein
MYKEYLNSFKKGPFLSLLKQTLAKKHFFGDA